MFNFFTGIHCLGTAPPSPVRPLKLSFIFKFGVKFRNPNLAEMLGPGTPWHSGALCLSETWASPPRIRTIRPESVPGSSPSTLGPKPGCSVDMRLCVSGGECVCLSSTLVLPPLSPPPNIYRWQCGVMVRCASFRDSLPPGVWVLALPLASCDIWGSYLFSAGLRCCQALRAVPPVTYGASV